MFCHITVFNYHYKGLHSPHSQHKYQTTIIEKRQKYLFYIFQKGIRTISGRLLPSVGIGIMYNVYCHLLQYNEHDNSYYR